MKRENKLFIYKKCECKLKDHMEKAGHGNMRNKYIL